MKTFKITVKLQPLDVESLLVSAFEGGSNYWYRIESPVISSGSYLLQALKKGIKVSNHYAAGDGERRKTRTLNARSIARGLSLLHSEAPHALADVINQNADAVTGDVFLQLCLFGKVIYG